MQLGDTINLARASALVQHLRPKLDASGMPIPIKIDPVTDLPIIDENVEIVHEETVHNVITNVGRVFLHTQGYGTSPGANGLNYIALSNDTLTETAASTTLSTEIAANGLARAQGTVTLPTGSGTQTTIAKTFTCATSAQAAQKAALFTASSGGTMNHALAFTQRSLQVGDTLAVTFTITLGA
jgi:hypothetical protein